MTKRTWQYSVDFCVEAESLAEACAKLQDALLSIKGRMDTQNQSGVFNDVSFEVEVDTRPNQWDVSPGVVDK